MENQTNTFDLQGWWNQLEFTGKEQFGLQENGELTLLEGTHNKDRVIATLNAVNADVVYKALQANYSEAWERMKTLEKEWVATEEKLKLSGKVSRTKDYLQRANALGDMQMLFAAIDHYEQTLSQATEEHYSGKIKLVETAEGMMDNDNWKETSEAFRDIINKWKQLGHADKDRDDELWKRLEAARHKFYERHRQNQQELEKEWMQNLDLKMEVVEKAEKLAASDEWKKTHEEFKELQEQWKAIGRTIPEKNEELWKRFIAAKNAFYDRKRAHSDFIQQELEANYALKIALAEKAEGMQGSTSWSATARAFNDLMEEWKSIGRVPQEKSDEIWNRFIAAKKLFFDAKHAYDKDIRATRSQNNEHRLALVAKAEELKHGTNWNDGTQAMNELLDEWKKIGNAGRENTDALWEQFIAARKFFFERKDAYWANRKVQNERHKTEKVQHRQASLQRLHDEVKEEEEKLVDFRNALENITPGKKAEELRQHLNNLIRESEEKIKHNKEKLGPGKNENPRPANQQQNTVAATEHTVEATPENTTAEEETAATEHVEDTANHEPVATPEHHEEVTGNTSENGQLHNEKEEDQAEEADNINSESAE